MTCREEPGDLWFDDETGEECTAPSTRVYGADTKNIGGRVMQWNPDTSRYDIDAGAVGGELTFDEEMLLKQTPTSSFSSSTSQSFQDPRALALQERGQDIDVEQFQQDYGLRSQQVGNEWQSFLKDFGLRSQTLQHTIANDTAQLNFLKQKSAWEQRQGEQAGARDTIRLMDQIQGRVNQEQFQLAQITQQAQTTNAQFAMRASELNEAARVANLQQRQSMARDIAEFTRNPGDVGAAAGFLRAGGGSDISTAIAEGKTAITPQSLAILNNMLAVSDEVMKNPRQIQAPQIGMPNYQPSQPLDIGSLMNQFAPPAAAGVSTEVSAPATTKAPPPLLDFTAGNVQGLELGASADFNYNGRTKTGTNYGTPTGSLSGVTLEEYALIPDWVKQKSGATFADGGILDGVGIVGDSKDGNPNEEVVIGDATIIPLDQFTPEQRKRIKAMAKKYATGGTIQNPLMRAQSFLDDAGKLAMQMGGFTNVPTPVGMARPGQSPYLANLGAAVAATTRGIPQELFLEELQRVTPRGVSENTLRRTR